MNQEELETRASVIRALSHPSRLLVVDELGRGARTVGELAGLAGCGISTMSRHLGLLRRAGLVEVEKQGNQVLCRLAAPCVLEFFDCVERMLNGDACPAAGCGVRR